MTSDCYMIFGVGKTLEYVTNSEEVKKLPDNAVKAINYYLEGIPEHNHKNHGSHNDSIQSNQFRNHVAICNILQYACAPTVWSY